MPITHVARCTAAALLAAGLGCASSGEQLDPDTDLVLAGSTYVLRSVASTAPPTVWVTNESVSITVLADTIVLRERGEGARIVVQRYREASAAEPVVRREESELAYTRRGDRVEIAFPCPDLALCVAPPHFIGRVAGTALVFDAALNYATPLRYERVSR